jgi:hypothetical protein
MQANVYTRERKHIASIRSSVSCLALPLAASQSLEHRALEDSQSPRCLTIATGNKQCKQINKQYIKQYLVTKKIVPTDATHHYEHMGVRII